MAFPHDTPVRPRPYISVNGCTGWYHPADWEISYAGNFDSAGAVAGDPHHAAGTATAPLAQTCRSPSTRSGRSDSGGLRQIGEFDQRVEHHASQGVPVSDGQAPHIGSYPPIQTRFHRSHGGSRPVDRLRRRTYTGANRVGPPGARTPLPAACRSVFLMRKFDHMPQKAIAAKLRVSENTVEKRMVRALRMILKDLKTSDADRDIRAERDSVAGKARRDA